ncbi:MAG TPA: hypothetical protein VH141_22130 [Pseudonocardia sp.]|nr:hypothetical protein [Pseudonocardia sp.]
MTAQRRTTGRGGPGRRSGARSEWRWATSKQRRRLVRLVIIAAGLLVILALVLSAMPPLPVVGPAQPADTSAPPQPGN